MIVMSSTNYEVEPYKEKNESWATINDIKINLKPSYWSSFTHLSSTTREVVLWTLQFIGHVYMKDVYTSFFLFHIGIKVYLLANHLNTSSKILKFDRS